MAGSALNVVRRVVGTTALLSLGIDGDVRSEPLSAITDQAERIEVTVVRVERLEHSTQLVVEVHNATDREIITVDQQDRSYGEENVSDRYLHNDLSGVHLLDEAAQVEYLPLRHLGEKMCVCSAFPTMEPDETLTGWWRSAPLPDSVTEVTVLGAGGQVLATGVEVVP